MENEVKEYDEYEEHTYEEYSTEPEGDAEIDFIISVSDQEEYYLKSGDTYWKINKEEIE